MFVSSCHRFLSLAVVLVSGCFAELTTDGEPDPTSEQFCVPGTVACACYGNGTCDPDLECVAEISACVPAGCTPGMLQCTCDGELCAEDLECNSGLCVEPESTGSSGEPDTDSTTGSSDASSTSGSPTSSPSTTEEPSTTSPDTTSSSTSESESDSNTESESDSGDPACNEMSCGACVQCVATPEGDCADEAADCTANAGCEAAAVCLASCGAKGFCFDDCCEDKTAPAIAAALALNVCRADRCATTCGDYNIGTCGG